MGTLFRLLSTRHFPETLNILDSTVNLAKLDEKYFILFIFFFSKIAFFFFFFSNCPKKKKVSN